MTGEKHDADKIRMDLLPFEALETVLHVYDSILIESEIKNAKQDATRLKEIMCDPPVWAPDMKLAVDVHRGKRWTKS